MGRGGHQPHLPASGPLQTRPFPTWLHVEELISPRLLFLHPPFLAACLAARVLHKGEAKGGLGEERQLMLPCRVCVWREEGDRLWTRASWEPLAFHDVTLSCTAFFFPIASAWRGESCPWGRLLLYFSLVSINPPEAGRGARRGAGGAGGRARGMF